MTIQTKKTTLDTEGGNTLQQLKDTPMRLKEAKEGLARTTMERLQLLQQVVTASSQKTEKVASTTQLAKEAFQKDIAEAKEAFDQEMALRHSDAVKQYVGVFVQQIDHY
ncbi:hypothetical protein BGZ65_005045 [Modicella reniformis]|uniref:Uncharacterized protein n=1 Tax=Modicella reniformis TaxID=1440133 RepID=A0A9P6SPH3_9FUNG|nr:hypothetical protein BGZ65_005045 [Modicella reniformis]